jgi:predicted DNA-binding transcriptional regulator YafY
VQPYRLGFQSEFGHWYLRGFDLAREGIRAFRLDRIDGPVVAGRPSAFEIPADERNASEILPDRWELGNDPPVVARVRIDPSHAPLARAQFDAEHIVDQHDDGSIDLEMVVTNRAAFRSMVLSFMEHAEVVSPPELRSEIVDWLEAIAEPREPAS